jgi:hypothetical protein
MSLVLIFLTTSRTLDIFPSIIFFSIFGCAKAASVKEEVVDLFVEEAMINQSNCRVLKAKGYYK